MKSINCIFILALFLCSVLSLRKEKSFKAMPARYGQLSQLYSKSYSKMYNSLMHMKKLGFSQMYSKSNSKMYTSLMPMKKKLGFNQMYSKSNSKLFRFYKNKL